MTMQLLGQGLKSYSPETVDTEQKKGLILTIPYIVGLSEDIQ